MYPHRKKILKTRPGNLANFSGGSGYMPFIVIFSAPLSFIGTFISNLVVHIAARKMFRCKEIDNKDFQSVDLVRFLKYAKIHLIVCFILAIIAGITFFIIGITMLYSFEAIYILEAFLIGAGPFIGYWISTYILVKLISKRGAKISNSFLSILVYIGIFIIDILLVYCIDMFPVLIL